ncbi:MAG TPA: IS21-like element helper ATPase IstB [Treponemataceae bacterium]|nr:IS21-like element helper ATPase IstB [Treponemataceae bacterium]
MTTKRDEEEKNLAMLLRALKLPSFAALYEETAVAASKQGWSFPRYLRHLTESELAARETNRVERMLKASGLPRVKTLETLDLERLPLKVRRQVPALSEGGFVDRAENVLVFGLPGRGKTHLVCAIGRELVARGRAVLFVPTFKLVQRLLVAKRELALEAELRKLDRFDAVILDDIGYVQQDREEMEVLFTFLGERYERRSVLITSNLVFSQWDRIFKDPMTTAAAIDRLVHHATILEMTSKKSVRAEEAEMKNGNGDCAE